MKSAVFAVLMAALVTSSVGCCSITDTILYGRQCPQTCRPGWGQCGSCDDCGSCPYGGSCGDSCGACSGCHGCPLFEVLGGLNPDRWLCLNEYCERGCCDTCGGGCSGGGCGKTYWGDWYSGDKAGCDSCDCHGNYAGGRRGRSHGGGETYYGGSMGGEIIEGERVHESGEPTPASPMDNGNGEGNPKVKPGPRDDMKSNEARRSTKPRMKTVSSRTTKAKRPVNLRTIDEEPQWTSRREEE
jgi:hypothetical protein